MAEIGQRVFAVDGTRNFLRLYNEEFVRPLSIPAMTTTSRFRIGMLIAVPDTGASFGVTMFVGLCNGADSPYTSVSTRHAMGWLYSSTFSYVANSGNPYYTCGLGGSGFYGVKRVNGSNTTTNFGTTAGVVVPGTPTGSTRRYAFIVDITPWNTIDCYTVATANAALDMTPNDFAQVMDTRYGGYSNLALTAQPQQTPGGVTATNLDTLDIYWSNGLVPLEIYNLCVYRFYYT